MSDKSHFSHQDVTFLRGVAFVHLVLDASLLSGAVLAQECLPGKLMSGLSLEGGIIFVTIVQMRKLRPRATQQGHGGAEINTQTAWL